MSHVPVSQSQIELVGRLIAQNRITREQLEADGAFTMDRPTLARYLDHKVLGRAVEEEILIDLEMSFRQPTPVADEK